MTVPSAPIAKSAPITPPLRGLILRNIGGVFVAQASTRLLALGTRLLLLKYFLSTFDFGVIAIAEGCIGYFNSVGLAGLVPAAMVLKHDEARLRATLFWMGMALTVITYAALFALAPLVLLLFDLKEVPDAAALPGVVRLLGLVMLIQLFTFTPRCHLLRHLANARAAWGQFASEAVRNGCTLAAAWTLAHGGRFPGVPGYVALIVGAFCGAAASVLVLHALAPVFPGRGFDRAIARDAWRYTRNLIAAEFSRWLMYTFDDLAVAALLGIRAAGLYSQSFLWGNKIVIEIAFIVFGVLLPAFARLQSEHERRRERFFEGLRALAAVIFPMSVGLWLVARDFADMLGGEWTAIATPLACFALMGLLRGLGGYSGRYLAAIGHTSPSLYFNAGYLVLGFPALVLCAREWGVDGAAWAVLAVNVALFPLALWFGRGFDELSILRQLRCYLRPAAATAVMAVIVLLAGEALPEALPPSRRLFVLVPIGALVYAVSALALMRRDLTAMGRAVFPTRAPPRS